MGESSTVVSAYTTYWHLQQYCSLPMIHIINLPAVNTAIHHTNYSQIRRADLSMAYLPLSAMECTVISPEFMISVSRDDSLP